MEDGVKPPPVVEDTQETMEEPNTSLDVGTYSLQKAHVSLGSDTSHARKIYSVKVRILEEDDPLIAEGCIDPIAKNQFANKDKLFEIRTDDSSDEEREQLVCANNRSFLSIHSLGQKILQS